MNKKRVFKILILSFLTGISIVHMVTPMAYADEEGLNMNREYLKINNISEVYTSITDIYGIPLFTDKTMIQNERIKREEKENMEKLKADVFLNLDEKKSSDEEFASKISQYNIFANPKTETKIKYSKNDAGIRFISVIGIIALSILTGIFTTNYYKSKRKKEADSIEYNNYA